MFAFQTSTPERKTPEASFSYPRSARITRGADLQRIVREGKRLRTEHIEVRVDASPLAQPLENNHGILRVGIIVPRFKHSAVARNRLKRRLRELVRVVLLPVGPPVDVVLRARIEAYTASFDALARDIRRADELLRRWHAERMAELRPEAVSKGEGQ